MKKIIVALIFWGLSATTVAEDVELYRFGEKSQVPKSGVANVQLNLLLGSVGTAFCYGAKLQGEYRKIYDDETYKIQLLKAMTNSYSTPQTLTGAKVTCERELFSSEIVRWYAGIMFLETTEKFARFTFGLSANWKPNMKYSVRGQIGTEDGVSMTMQARISPNLALTGGFELFPLFTRALKSHFDPDIKWLQALSLGCNYYF